MSSPNIRKSLIDKFGFVWFATQEGLSRFDGVRFINFSSYGTNEKRTLLYSDVFDICQDENLNCLWALTTYGGLDKIDLRSCSVTDHFSIKKYLESDSATWLTCLTRANDRLYIASDEGLIFYFNSTENQFKRKIDLPSQYAHSHIEKLTTLNEHLYVWLNDGNVLIFDRDLKFEKAHQAIQFGKKNANNHIRDILALDNKYFLIGTTEGLKIISSSSLNTVHFPRWFDGLPQQLYKKEVFALSDSKIAIVISSILGCFRIDKMTGTTNTLVPAVNPNESDWFSSATSILQSGKALWLGSHLGVAYIQDIDPPFTPYTNSWSTFCKIDHAIDLLPINDSIMYLTAVEGVYRINMTNSRIEKLTGNGAYYSALKVSPTNTLFSGDAGTFSLDQNKKLTPATIFTKQIPQFEKSRISVVENYKDSLLFMATDTSLIIWNNKNKSLRILSKTTTPIALKSLVINRLYIDNSERLWILHDYQIGIYDLKTDRIKYISLTNKSNNEPMKILMDICEINNHKFLAVYGVGIVAIDNNFTVKKIYNTSHGLTNLGLYRIIPVGDSALLTSSNNGLSLLNLNTGSLRMYFEEDGLQSNNFEERSGTALGSFIYFGGINGITRIDPSKFSTNTTKPPLYISEINTITNTNNSIDTFNLLLPSLTIPNDVTQTTISFTALDYSMPGKLTYAYKIDEIHNDWLPLGSQNSIKLTGLDPGTYTLRISTGDDENLLSNNRVLQLIFLPKWYQTIWFKMILILICAGAIYGIYRYRLFQMQQEELIRTRIAADLHDDIGSTLTSVRIFSELSMTTNSIEYLPHIKRGLQEASISLRDTIWLLDKSNNNGRELTERVEKFIEPLASAGRVKFEIIKDEFTDGVELTTEHRRELYLAIKEFINNSLKYSECKKVTVTFSKYKKGLQIQLKDDGCGFDIEAVKKGNGLNNIKNRATKIGYSASLTSQHNNGTNLILLPAN